MNELKSKENLLSRHLLQYQNIRMKNDCIYECHQVFEKSFNFLIKKIMNDILIVVIVKIKQLKNAQSHDIKK